MTVIPPLPEVRYGTQKEPGLSREIDLGRQPKTCRTANSHRQTQYSQYINGISHNLASFLGNCISHIASIVAFCLQIANQSAYQTQTPSPWVGTSGFLEGEHMDQPMKPIIAPTWTIAIPTLARPDHSGRPRGIFDGVQHRGG